MNDVGMIRADSLLHSGHGYGSPDSRIERNCSALTIKSYHEDLESLLASSTHLSRLASLMQQGFSSGREASEKRT